MGNFETMRERIENWGRNDTRAMMGRRVPDSSMPSLYAYTEHVYEYTFYVTDSAIANDPTREPWAVVAGSSEYKLLE